MSFDEEFDATRVHAMAFQLKELTTGFHRSVGQRLASWNIPAHAITEQDRVAIENEVVFDALCRAGGESLGATGKIIPNAVDEAVRLILIHVAETAQSYREGPDCWSCDIAAKGH
jgi:hypothetical protein